jgi:hypothetical protein
MDSETAVALHAVPDDELLQRLAELVSQSRRVEADLVAHIGEADERRLYARQAFPSMFAYATRALHLSEAEAYRRITVARAARRHPQLLAALRDGRVHLSGLALLAPLVTSDNCASLLERATHRSKREVEELVAEIAPRPDAPSAIRKLPQRRNAPAASLLQSAPAGPSEPVDPAGPIALSEPAAVLAATGPSEPASLAAGDLRSSSRSAPSSVGFASAGECQSARDGGADAPVDPELFPGRVGQRAAALASPSVRRPVEPLSPARHRVQFTASAELKDKLERLQSLMRHEVPDGDLAAVIERAVSEKLERLEARRFAKTAAPRKTLTSSDTSPKSRHIPAAVRRAVRDRAGSRCGFVDAQGRRCSEQHRLEFHHRHPFGMGGDHSPDNVGLLCTAHNRYLAERDYGEAAIARRLRGGPGG